jgi:DNA-binding CsgD family transcriptional regulator
MASHQGLHSVPVSMRMTEREKDVLCLLAAGLTSDEAAATLNISRHTVVKHVMHMMRRTGSATRTELVARAIANRVIDVTEWPPVACRS